MFINTTPYDKVISIPTYHNVEGTMTFSVYCHQGKQYCNISTSFSDYSIIGVSVDTLVSGNIIHKDVSLGEEFTVTPVDEYSCEVRLSLGEGVFISITPKAELNKVVNHLKECIRVKNICERTFKKKGLLSRLKRLYSLPTRLFKI